MNRGLLSLLLLFAGILPAAQSGQEKSAADWLPLLQSNNPDERQTAAYELGDMRARDSDVVTALAACLHDSEPRVRAEAADALGRIGYSAREAVPDLLTALRTDKDEAVRASAVLALGYIGSYSQDAIPVVADALRKDKNALVRSNAAMTLGRLGSAAKAAVPALVDALRDPHLDVQRHAREALKRLDPDKLK